MALPPQAALSPGMLFHGRYEIVRCLAAGGMGAVYECVHRTTQKHRALKVMLPEMLASPGMRERFELEARVTAQIDSEHIVETFDAGVDPATEAPFLVMELLRGEDLDAILRDSGPFTWEDTVLLLSQAALALDKTHAAGIVHRDLKPQNLFRTTHDNGTPRLKILDFGIAKVIGDGTRTAAVSTTIGTPIYMAPEQTTGEGGIGPGADLFALGHIAYTLLTGEPYWSEEARTLPVLGCLSVMLAGPTEAPTVRAGRRGVALPHAFDAWFARSTARRAEDRFDRASVQVAELAVALGVTAPRFSTGPVAHVAQPRLAASTVSAAQSSQPAPAHITTTGGTMGAVAKAPTGSRSSRATLGLLLVVLTVASGAATVGVVRGLRHEAPATTATSAGPVSTAEPVLATAAPTVMPLPPPTVESTDGGTPAPSTPASVESAKKPAKPAGIPKAAPICNPPFTVDASGARHAKPECL